MGVNTKIKILQKEEVNKNIFKFKCLSPEIAKDCKPGQFIEIRVSKTFEPFLRRPISIYNVDIENQTIEFIFQVKGRGTEFLSQMEEGDLLDVIGPLGENGFDVKKCKNIAIIGGGIGIFPLYELAKRNISSINVYTYLGFRNSEMVMLEKEFEKVSTKLTITTDDGSYGKSGYAINYLKEEFERLNIDGIFACGPLPMLKSIQEFARNQKIYCQISLEEMMGCGIGACLGCAVKYKTDTEDTFKRVCKEGPVFNALEVEI